MAIRWGDTFILDGLVEPQPKAEMSRLLRFFREKLEPHPKCRGWSKQRQLWELHRALHGERDVTLVLIAEHYAQDKDRKHLPTTTDVKHLAQICCDAWLELARLGINVGAAESPLLPMPRARLQPALRPRIIDNNDPAPRPRHRRVVIDDDNEDPPPRRRRRIMDDDDE